jgi:hypothetical protein
MVILYSCSFDEAAGNSGARGGWYSSALLDAARSWDQRTPVNTESEYAILSVLQAHDMAIPEVRRLSDNEQNPDREQPRGSKKYYPFAIIA